MELILVYYIYLARCYYDDCRSCCSKMFWSSYYIQSKEVEVDELKKTWEKDKRRFENLDLELKKFSRCLGTREKKTQAVPFAIYAVIDFLSAIIDCQRKNGACQYQNTYLTELEVIFTLIS